MRDRARRSSARRRLLCTTAPRDRRKPPASKQSYAPGRAAEIDTLLSPEEKPAALAQDSCWGAKLPTGSRGSLRVSISQQKDRRKSSPRLPLPLPGLCAPAAGGAPRRKATRNKIFQDALCGAGHTSKGT